jgi:uncharacterized protein (TIGR03663 family)
VIDAVLQEESRTASPAISEVSSRAWMQALFYVAAAAMLLRFYDLPLKPLHHDEGVNALFLAKLVQPPHVYKYDPANYHGPTLYYFGWLSALGLGLSTVSMRVVTAVTGMLAVFAFLALRRRIGAAGAISAAVLFAVSPGAVYFSRYYIHEMLLICFTLWAVVLAAVSSPRTRLLYLSGAAAAAGLAFATKETAIITAAVIAIAAVSSRTLLFLREPGPDGQRMAPLARLTRAATATFRALLPGRRSSRLLVTALFVFVAVNVLFYSSFFTHWPGVMDAVRSFAIWTGTGTTAHVQPWPTYLRWLAAQEPSLLVLGALGAALALWRGTDRFMVFSALWAVGMIAAYSLIPYKTPWLTLNMLAPLAICAGHACDRAWRLRRGTKTALAVAALLAFGLSTGQALALNFRDYDDDRNPYVYAHTSREVLLLVDRLAQLQAAHGPLTIAVTSPDQFPLSWYLRGYRAGYYGRPTATGDPVVIASEDQQAVLTALLGGTYEAIGTYGLRPGVRLILYVRRDLRRPPIS